MACSLQWIAAFLAAFPPREPANIGRLFLWNGFPDTGLKKWAGRAQPCYEEFSTMANNQNMGSQNNQQKQQKHQQQPQSGQQSGQQQRQSGQQGQGKNPQNQSSQDDNQSFKRQP